MLGNGLQFALVLCLIAPVAVFAPFSSAAATATPAARTDVGAAVGAPALTTRAASRCEGVRLPLRTRPNLEGGLTFVGALLNEGPGIAPRSSPSP